MLTVELHVRDIPSIYARFSSVIGDKHWRKRVELLTSEIRGNPFLERLLTQENAIAFQLERLRSMHERHGGAPSPEYDDRTIYAAASFAAQVLSVLDASDDKTGERLKRRVHGAMKNPSDMRGLRLELTAATHFLRAGRKVSWPEMVGLPEEQGVASFDLLVEDVGRSGLEIECKSFSDQTGRRVSRRQALDFYGLVRRHHWPQLLQLSTGRLGVLTVPGDLPTDLAQKKLLADALVRNLLYCADGEYQEEGANIRVSQFDPRRLSEIPAGASKRRARVLLDEVSGTRNREVLVVGTEKHGAFMLVVQSARDDEVLDSIFATLGSSVGRQFSKQRAAMFVVGLEGMDSQQLLEVAQGDKVPGARPSDLWREASRFMEPKARDHLVGVCFISAGGLRPGLEPGVVDSGGTAYNFPRHTSRFWSEEFRRMFGAEPTKEALAL